MGRADHTLVQSSSAIGNCTEIGVVTTGVGSVRWPELVVAVDDDDLEDGEGGKAECWLLTNVEYKVEVGRRSGW